MNIQIKDKTVREIIGNFFWMFLSLVSFRSIKQLHAVGQGVSEILIDSVGISVIFTALMFITKKQDSKSPTATSL